MKAFEIGERKIIDIIWSILEKDNHLLDQVLPHPDDASAIKLNDYYILLKTDMLVRKTDIPKRMRMEKIGSKVIVMNTSDMISKGAKPLAFLYSLGIPRNFSIKKLKSIIIGMSKKAKDYGIKILGGDLGEADDLIISGFLIGISKRIIKRSGANIGDIIATTGRFGNTSASYKILLEGFYAPRNLRRKICKSIYEPNAKINFLSICDYVTSSMDSSDGLAYTLNELSKSSNLCFKIYNIPIAKEAIEFAKLNSLNPEELALYGGEEYEIVFTVKKDKWNEVLEIARNKKFEIIKIGEVFPGRGVFLVKNSKEIEIPYKGWEHFK